MYARHKIFLHKTEPNVANSGLGIQVGSRKKDRKKQQQCLIVCQRDIWNHLTEREREREREGERGERECVCVCVSFRYTEESEATSAVNNYITIGALKVFGFNSQT